MKKPILAVDIDEVLFPFNAELLRHWNEQDGTSHTIEQMVDLDLRFWGLSDAEAIERVHEFSRRDHLHIAPIAEAKEALEQLAGQYRVAIVTSRDPEFEAGTRAWLEYHIPKLYDEIILTGNRYSGRPYRSKVGVCREIGAKLLVDDQLHYAVEAAKGGLPVILFGEYPWNRAEQLPEGAVRMKDWPAIEDYLLKEEVA